ncbi:hypothetical protein EJ04DRAFT_453054 [Polyplosphaeria fusca]|uniref:Uncharacterized protein n=1 Tax=Polyplosphaeria fusca TaxID=682080 RepID=A0A9P4UTX3_9PLEO|nr:hypothetical protein EJ04DRAFT_453054 [Polyplosphaeria fusca]
MINLSLDKFVFVFLFLFRYFRLFVHLLSFWVLYRPKPIPKHPKIGTKDCTVVIPTIDPQNSWFTKCLESIAANHPGAIYIVTVGNSLLEQTERIVHPIRTRYPNLHIEVSSCPIASKRIQLAHVIPKIPASTKVIALVDDHVTWPSTAFLRTALAPFEEPNVGLVGTNKRVVRLDHGSGLSGLWGGFWNFLGAVYLERHNFEIRATSSIDGGVFVISGRTSLHRASILRDPAFLHSFQNEKVLGFGPIAADDDNHITRWNVRHGWDIRIQYCEDAMIETTVGEYPRYLSQCLRWVRTTWRSNSCTLFTDRTVWKRQPWSVYAIHLTSLVNFALFYDAGLIYSLKQTAWAKENGIVVTYLILWIFASKMIKLVPYFLRHPHDLIYIPGYILFAYYHSLIKLWALVTFGSNAWCGRNLAAVEAADVEKR